MHVNRLTHPDMQGRDAGTYGADLARDYIMQQAAAIGLLPAFHTGWTQAFYIDLEAESYMNENLRNYIWYGTQFPDRKPASQLAMLQKHQASHAELRQLAQRSANQDSEYVLDDIAWNVAGVLPGSR